MTKRILVIPDVHGRVFWKAPVRKYASQVDRIVFLGDYLDPYGDEDKKTKADDIYQNLMEIIELKRRNMDKVVLLKGNHDQHYYSKRFDEQAGGTRQDLHHWAKYHHTFAENKELFKIAYSERVNALPYLFSHAGLTSYWLKKVNKHVWNLDERHLSVSDPSVIERINQLDDEGKGQDMLSVIGSSRSWFGEKTGSVLWADVGEHNMHNEPHAYGLDQVFQVFGHTRLRPGYDKIESDHFAMIDSRQCFMIDEAVEEKILTIEKYEARRGGAFG